MAKFNMIGFNFNRRESNKVYKHCILCAGVILQPDPHDDSKLMCFSCGYSILEKEAPNAEGISIPHDKQHKPMVVSGDKRKKKYYDKSGNLITDETLIQDIRQGKNVIYYNEQKSGDKEVIHIDKERKRLVQRQDR